MKWKTKKVVVVAMVGAVIGVIFTLMDFIYMPLSAVLGVVFMEVAFGIYMLSPLVPMYLVRKPGAAIFGIGGSPGKPAPGQSLWRPAHPSKPARRHRR